MVSEFRKAKLMRGFQFIDTDKNGSINKADFDLALEKAAKARGWQTGDAKYKEAQDIMGKIWAGIQSKADKNNDGEVSDEEWLALWDEYSKNPSNPADFQNLYCKFIFSLIDAGGDGQIDADEFVAVVTSFGRVQKDEATRAFQKLSKGGSPLSWEQYQQLWREYFVSEDQNAAGNSIFGRDTI